MNEDYDNELQMEIDVLNEIYKGRDYDDARYKEINDALQEMYRNGKASAYITSYDRYMLYDEEQRRNNERYRRNNQQQQRGTNSSNVGGDEEFYRNINEKQYEDAIKNIKNPGAFKILERYNNDEKFNIHTIGNNIDDNNEDTRDIFREYIRNYVRANKRISKRGIISLFNKYSRHINSKQINEESLRTVERIEQKKQK